MNKIFTPFICLAFVALYLLLSAMKLPQIINPNKGSFLDGLLSDTSYTFVDADPPEKATFPNFSISTENIALIEPAIDFDRPGKYSIDIKITGADFIGDGASIGIASIPLSNTTHQIGSLANEWAYATANGRFKSDGVATSYWESSQQSDNVIRLEYDTQANTLDYYLKRSNLSTFYRMGSTYAFTGVLPAAGKQLAFAASARCLNGCSLTIVASSIPKKAQEITFSILADKTFGDADFDAGATASSGLTVSYSSDNTAVATIVDGKIHIESAGTATITASQPGNGEYSEATARTQVLTVNKVIPVLSDFDNITKTNGDADFALTPPTSNSNGAFTYTSSDENVATISGNTVTIVGAGETEITATQAETDNYEAGTIKLTLSVTGGTLPVTLVNYTAKAEGNYANLQWQTTTETRNKGFIIYRSGDDSEFVPKASLWEKIGEVPASHISNLTSQIHNYTDKNPLNGNNYYKLVQIDNDGKTTELGVKQVNFALPTSDIRLFPNPTGNVLNISFDSGKYNSLTLSNLSGKTLQQVQIKPEDSNLIISLKNCPVGTYLLRLSGNQGTETRKVAKR